MTFEKFLALAAGGLTGTFLRYYFSVFVHHTAGPRFPLATLLVNLLGCFVAGLFVGWGEEKIALSPETRLLVITGFCGAFTTFSAFILETETLFRGGAGGYAALNIFANIILGFLLFRGGMLLAKAF